jgi:hypothetical protein
MPPANRHNPVIAEVRRFKRYATKQGRQSWTLYRLWAPRPSHGRDDLPRVLDLASPVVLRHVPHVEHSMRLHSSDSRFSLMDFMREFPDDAVLAGR